MAHIYILAPYPQGEAPSQRFRYEQYLKILNENGHQYYISSFLTSYGWQTLYKPGHFFQKGLAIAYGFCRRFTDLVRMARYNLVFIHREATPIGPPIFEWIIAKIFRKKIIYDFDDAIWLPNTSENNRIAAGLKWHSKVANICRWANIISCGNAYLADYARLYNKNVIVNPTTIDTVGYHNRIKNQDTASFTIGWTGTHSTIQYLDVILPILKKLEEHYDFTFIVISNSAPDFELNSLKYLQWSKETEIDDLMLFNIGIMPLTDDPWAKGKCGFKALQYMSLGIPALVSPIGVNCDIVDDGINGMICNNAEDWELALKTLLLNPALKIKLGKEARKKIENNYSVLSNIRNFLALFQ